MGGWKASLMVPAAERLDHERALEPLSEQGFIVTSRETALNGPWCIEIFGEGERPTLDDTWQWEALPDKDWVAENQRSFKPFAIGPFWVHPSHDAAGMPAGKIPLRIDAGMAFGTGTHATTRGCLEMLEMLDPRETANAVDVGCGSGILAIAMAKLWRRPVVGGDNDPEAVTVAIENAALNGVADLCHFHVSIGLQTPELAAKAPYDLIVANILFGPLIELSTSFVAARRVLLSGILIDQAPDIVDLYTRRGFALEHQIDRETGGAWWRTLLLRRI